MTRFIDTPINFLTRKKAGVIIGYSTAKAGVSAKEMLSPSRRYPVVRARQQAMRLAFTHTRMSTTQIGDLFGRHHVTVLYAAGRLSKFKRPLLSRLEREQTDG